METLSYRQVIQDLLQARAMNHSEDGVEVELIFDRERDRYLVMLVGWHNQRREYSSLIHIDIKDSKIWVQSDGTETGIANELVKAGIPKQDIVLGYKSPFKRQFTEYAIN
ncbi:XisI protein [Geitlerinema calcuttense]|uniref:XisI protein n=1 Tax=Geitlerinema calcuttense NRMC-F 0142 TaxID=2922238 RepID=A0ABT7M0F2_9CYAN|nr:XisI protein [Geitlerinema calcuttense]MDI9640688.1 XisI protein [Geitlerinema splendidum]MDL5057728.1 XisI protein [Geitlerinema calcuttense NRMC-F 0142]